MVDPAFWRGRSVLVTGHTGFKGAWLTLWLHALGARVTGIAPGPPTDPSLFALARVAGCCESHAVDVRDAEALDRAVAEAAPEVVFHLAAQALVRRSLREVRETYDVNVMGTVNLLEAVRRAGSAAAIVNVTSDKCYENREWEWAYREDEPMGGADPYSSSKGCAELVTGALRRSFALPVASARAGNVVGGGDWGEDRLVPDLMRGALAATPVVIRRPDAVRPWQHVLNPLSGYLLLAQRLATEGGAFATAFNFGPSDEDARPVRHLAARLAQRWPEPLELRLDAGPHPPEATSLKLDSSRARARLGWGPRWALDAGLDAVVDWYLALRRGDDVRTTTLAQIEAYGG